MWEDKGDVPEPGIQTYVYIYIYICIHLFLGFARLGVLSGGSYNSLIRIMVF